MFFKQLLSTIVVSTRGYINMYAVYIIWLVSAVFHHLPTLDELGMNVKADISIIISVFSATFVVRTGSWRRNYKFFLLDIFDIISICQIGINCPWIRHKSTTGLH